MASVGSYPKIGVYIVNIVYFFLKKKNVIMRF